MKIFIARHGRTNENAERKLSGNSNKAQLITDGLEHAKNLGEIFKNFNPQSIFSSPLDRAMQTAKPLSEALNMNIKVIEELREFDFGLLDSKVGEGEAREALVKRREDHDFKFPEGESYNEVLKRVESFLNGLLKQPYSEVFIVGHGGVNRCLLSTLVKGTDKKDLDKIDNPNSVVYEVDTEKWTCTWQNTLTGEKGKGLLFRETY